MADEKPTKLEELARGAMREPSTREALEQARELREGNRDRVESSDGNLYADRRRTKGSAPASWNIRRAGDNNAAQVDCSDAKRGRIFGTLETRNRRAVQAVLDALEPFHRGDTL